MSPLLKAAQRLCSANLALETAKTWTGWMAEKIRLASPGVRDATMERHRIAEGSLAAARLELEAADKDLRELAKT